MSEIKKVTKLFQRQKTPGLTLILTLRIFRPAWRKSSGLLQRSLPRKPTINSQRRGIVFLIPKIKENLNEITCWHPITLLNINYKIIARIIATHIEPSLLSFIHTDQKCKSEALEPRLAHSCRSLSRFL